MAPHLVNPPATAQAQAVGIRCFVSLLGVFPSRTASPSKTPLRSNFAAHASSRTPLKRLPAAECSSLFNAGICNAVFITIFAKSTIKSKTMDDSTELNGLKYIGDVPMVYKGAAYEEYYEPLYVQMVGDKPFYAVKTENGIEAVAIVKESSIPFITKDRVFKYNAENDNICVKIPM